MGKIRNEILTFAKAQLTAQVATIVDFGMTIFLAEACGMWYAYATFLGAVSGGIVNCCLNYRWVFHAQGQKKKYVALRYFLVWTGSILLNTLGTYALTELSGTSYIIMKALVAVIVGIVWNYQMQRFFVFRHPKSQQAEPEAESMA